MVLPEGKSFSDKHGTDASADPRIRDAIVDRAKDKTLPCAVAFKIAETLEVTPDQVGKNVDLLNYRLSKCQIGLFGYSPEKKIVKPRASEKGELESAIEAAAVEGRVTCRAVWEIAARFNVHKMTVSSACEAMNIKIKPCQLGAF